MKSEGSATLGRGLLRHDHDLLADVPRERGPRWPRAVPCSRSNETAFSTAPWMRHSAANSDGDSDSVACIAGGLVGARLGAEAIPLPWRQRIESSEYLTDLANRLAAAKQQLNLA